MRGAIIAAFVGVLACQRDAATTPPDEAPSGVSEGPGAPSSPEDRGETEEPIEATLEIEGGLTEAQVQKVVDQHFTDIRKCFDLALANPDGAQLLEPIVVKVEVDPTGAVAKSELETSKFDDEPTESCIVERAGEWKFPAPKGKKPATLHMPFMLRSY